MVAAVFAAATLIGLSGAVGATPVQDVPLVDLSASNPAAVHHADGSWTVPIHRSPREPADQPRVPVGFCRGTYIDPEIVARGAGTAVHFAVKYFCSRPVEYSARTGVDSFYDEVPGGPVISHGGGVASGGGVSQNPYVEGFSPPCRTNQNSGWEPWDDSVVRGQKHSGRGKRVTIGCRV